MSEFSRGTDFSSRAVIDVAIGVLVGWRGCSQREAFDELAAAVRDTGIGIGSLARALVDLACDADPPARYRAVAQRVWGDVMPQRPTRLQAPGNRHAG
jgi:hypothetical protein